MIERTDDGRLRLSPTHTDGVAKSVAYDVAIDPDGVAITPRARAMFALRIAQVMLGGVALSLLPAQAASPTFAGATFVVDPGHGTRYPDGSELNVGAVGAHGVQERTVVLGVAEDVARLLRQDGARVVLTRSYARPFRTATILRLDNRARAALANRLHATAFVAIHADASPDAGRRGTSVFWLRPNSSTLARAMRRRLRSLDFGEAEFRARDLAVTSEARVPAVLVEIGFVSNPAQASQLSRPDFRERIAEAIVAALRDTFADSREGRDGY